MLTWDREPARRVIMAVHGADQPFVVAEMTRSANHEVTHITHYRGTVEEHLKRFERTADQPIERYMVVAQTQDNSARAEKVVQSWAIAIDFDAGLPELCELGAPLSPTFVIQTSHDRYHGFYVLREPATPDQMSRLSKALAFYLRADMAFARINQMVRLPGFMNQKHGTQVVLKEQLSSGKNYDYHFLSAAVDAQLYEAYVENNLPQVNHLSRLTMRDRPEVVKNHLALALEHLAAQGYAGEYSSWIKVLLNLSALGPDGESLARAFSARSEKFSEVEFERKWRNVVKNTTGAISTIFAMAQSEGWKNPGWIDGESSEPAHGPTERDFGHEVAQELAPYMAAVEHFASNTKKSPIDFLLWADGKFVALDHRQRRARIAEAGAVVLARKREGKNLSWLVFQKKLGTNSGLDDLSEHVAESLVPMSRHRIVERYPYLPVENGVVNLLVQKLVPAIYQPIPLKTAPVYFDPQAMAPRFRQYLYDIFFGSTELGEYLLRALGYSLIGKPREQVLFILLGPHGSNGKSTLMDLMLDLLGPFAGRLKTETLMQKSHVNNGADPALSSFEGKRFAVTSEPAANHKLDTSLVKQITGDTKMQMRDVFASSKDVVIQFCIFMMSNHMPFAAAEDRALWRRIRIIPFPRVFSDEEKDGELLDALIRERSGIFNVLLEGLADYLAQGLNAPEKVLAEVNERRKESDPVEMFLRTQCEEKPGEQTSLKFLWVAFESWSKLNTKFQTLSKNEFQTRLEAKFERTTKGHLPYFVGLKMTSTVE